MSRNFHPCKLVPQIHVSHFRSCIFDRPVFSCLAFSVAPIKGRMLFPLPSQQCYSTKIHQSNIRKYKYDKSKITYQYRSSFSQCTRDVIPNSSKDVVTIRFDSTAICSFIGCHKCRHLLGVIAATQVHLKTIIYTNRMPLVIRIDNRSNLYE